MAVFTPHHHTLKVYGTKKTFIQEYGQCKIFNTRKKNIKPKIIDINYKNTDKTYILNSFIIVTKKKIFFQKKIFFVQWPHHYI